MPKCIWLHLCCWVLSQDTDWGVLVPLPWAIRAPEHGSALCWSLLPRLRSGTWASPGGRPATPLLPQLWKKLNLAPGAWPFSLQPSRAGAGDAAHHHLHRSASPRREDTGRAVLRGQAGTILFLLQLVLPFSVLLGGGIDVAETFLTLGWEL